MKKTIDFLFMAYLITAFAIMNSVFFQAYFSPNQIIEIDLNSIGEADVEFVFCVIGIIIFLTRFADYFFKKGKRR